MKCKKYYGSEVSGMSLMLSDDSIKNGIITNAREMLHICLRCEHLTTKECSPDTREKIFTFLELNDEPEE